MPADNKVVNTPSDETQPPASETSSLPKATGATPSGRCTARDSSQHNSGRRCSSVSLRPKSNFTQPVELSGSRSPQPGSQHPAGEQRANREDVTVPAGPAPILAPRSTPAVEDPGQQHSLPPASAADARRETGFLQRLRWPPQRKLRRGKLTFDSRTAGLARQFPWCGQVRGGESHHRRLAPQFSCDEYVLPRSTQTQQKSQLVQASAEIGAASNQALVAKPSLRLCRLM